MQPRKRKHLHLSLSLSLNSWYFPRLIIFIVNFMQFYVHFWNFKIKHEHCDEQTLMKCNKFKIKGKKKERKGNLKKNTLWNRKWRHLKKWRVVYTRSHSLVPNNWHVGESVLVINKTIHPNGQWRWIEWRVVGIVILHMTFNRKDIT